jgi:hypothetical protein
MVVDHAGPGKTHDFPDFGPHFPLITVYRAFGAGRLALLERTFLEALSSVIQQIPAFCASCGDGVLPAAVERYHSGDRFIFPGNPGMHNAHLIILRRKIYLKIFSGSLY